MYKTEGYWNVKPKIKRLSFPRRGRFQVDLLKSRTMPTEEDKLLFKH